MLSQRKLLDDLLAEVKTRSRNGTMTAQLMDRYEHQADDLRTAIKSEARAAAFMGASEMNPDGTLMMATGTKGSRGAPSLRFNDEQLKALHTAVISQQSIALKTGFNTAVDELPAQLYPSILGPIHENRLLDRLPTFPVSAPSIEYVRHISTTGAPAIVAEGQQKPELIFAVDHVIATVQKIACHAGVSHEALSDYGAFVSYLQNEIVTQVVDVENDELLNGTGPGHITGFLDTPSILTHVTGSESSLDAIEIAISKLRTGSSLAEANLLVLNPGTWSAIRRTKDLQDRYLVNPDPTQGAGNQLWGVEVLVTTAIDEAVGVLLDTRKFGKALVRESLTVRTGTDGGDFTRNIVRFVCEERLTLAVERPTAVCKITNLPVQGS